jgi:GT2 family glycosyltransferase
MVIMCFTPAWLHANGGHLLHPEYDGYWSDTEYSWRAHKSKQVIDARHIRFFHNHPAFTNAPSDAAYARQHNPEANARGQKIFAARNPDCPLANAQAQVPTPAKEGHE